MEKGLMQVAVDAVLFTILNNDLNILLIKRKNDPFKGKYALLVTCVDSQIVQGKNGSLIL